MLGNRSPQGDIFDVGNVFPTVLREKSFHAQLAKAAPTLFSDADFEALYSSCLGRPSVPPSQLALLTLLQWYHGVSDQSAVDYSGYDLRWCAVLGRPAGEPLCAKSTFQMFRAHLLLHEKHALLFQRSLDVARKKGLLRTNEIKTALDTKPILGRGAVEDTYNLIGGGMLHLARAIARSQQVKLPAFLAKHDLERLGAPSIKGSVDIDWSSEVARHCVLTELVADARKLMTIADATVPEVKRSAALLEQVLLQDIEEFKSAAGVSKAAIKKGTAKGRIPSVTDPEQRHGRKSASKRFNGAKASVSADIETGLILSTEVISGDSPDATGAVKLVDRAEEMSGCTITEVLADCAYGSGETRKEFADANRELVAKVPASPTGPLFSKSSFRIELPAEGQSLEHAKVTCPGGAVAGNLTTEPDGGVTFYFDAHCNDGCPLRAKCTNSFYGRSLHLHAQEKLIQDARAQQATEEGRKKLRKRLIIENALARLAHHGISQARYIGHAKTRFQLAITATVVNLRRIWNWADANPQLTPATQA
jgi:hypothetical protein